MLRRKDSVLFMASALDACALWRLFMPHLNMAGSRFLAFAGAPDLNAVARHDVLVVQRMFSQQQFEFLRMAQALGVKIIYDLDDDVWDVPDYNPARGPLASVREGFGVCMRMVDVVTVSTRTLAKVLLRNTRTILDPVSGRRVIVDMVNTQTGRRIPVIVAENRIDTRLFSQPAPVDPDRMVIGWAGSSSHIGDIDVLVEALATVTAENPAVRVQFRGCPLPPDHPLRRLPDFEFRHWYNITEYGARMPQWGWTIALAPVTEHEFNASKSCIKAVEAAYCGIPCLCSWMRPYEEFCHHDPELKWLLCSTARHWREKLRDLVNDRARREELGRRARIVAMEHYSFRGPHEGWQEALEAARA